MRPKCQPSAHNTHHHNRILINTIVERISVYSVLQFFTLLDTNHENHNVDNQLESLTRSLECIPFLSMDSSAFPLNKNQLIFLQQSCKVVHNNCRVKSPPLRLST